MTAFKALVMATTAKEVEDDAVEEDDTDMMADIKLLESEDEDSVLQHLLAESSDMTTAEAVCHHDRANAALSQLGKRGMPVPP